MSHLRLVTDMTPAEARAIAVAQDEYGIWNTAPAWNRYYALKRSQQSPLRRFVGTVMGRLLDACLLVAGWVLLMVPFIAWWF